jgi:3-phosphoglycerate kinase
LPRLFEEKFAGNLLLNEIHYIGKAITNPPKPYVAIIGGAKISGKIDVIQNLFEKCDTILIGGGLAYTFFKALGYNVGNSIVESEKIELAKSLLENAKSMNKPLILPKDVIVAEKLSQDSEIKNVRSEDIPEGWMGVDIGYETRQQFRDLILGARMVVWNGPVGVFEIEKFAEGTKAVALAMVEATSKGSITIVGGGDSAAAIAQLGLKDKVSHVSTGGGASLDYLAGKPLPGILALEV